MFRKQLTKTTKMLHKLRRSYFLEILLLAWYFSWRATADDMVVWPSTRPPPIDVRDIGYNGTWDTFCDPEQIEKDFPLYPERDLHELRIMRIVLCEMKKNDSIAPIAMPAFAGYKYCEMMRPKAEGLLKDLFDRFSGQDPQKREELLTRDFKNQSQANRDCYVVAEDAVRKKCIHKENAYFRMFRPLMFRACMVEWLKLEDILEGIEKVCDGRYMSGRGVNWNQIMHSIKYRGVPL